MADQNRDQEAGAEQTVVIPAWKWPRTEPDAPTAPHQALLDYLDKPDGPKPVPPGQQGQSGNAGQPGGPPGQSGQPGQPGNGGQPGQSGQPGNGGRPGQSGQPGNGGQSGQPGQPGNGGQPGAPGKPWRAGLAGPEQPGERTLGNLLLHGWREVPGQLQEVRNRLPGRRGLLVAGIVFGGLLLLYCGDLALASGEVPRGSTVAGVDVGGLDRGTAEQRLRQALEPHLRQPVPVSAGDVQATVDPAAAGLELDWAATLDRAGAQPLNPWTRLQSLFTSREVGTVTRTDRPKLTAAVEVLSTRTDHDPVEGIIRFEGVTPVPVDPRPGQRLDRPRAVEALLVDWATGRTIALPVQHTPVRSTPDDVQAALEDIAKPAVSGPVRITGEGADATLTPDVIAAALTFEVGQDGALGPKYDLDRVTEAVRPQLAKTEKPGKDATVVLEGGGPVVRPSTDGRGVDWAKSLEPLPDVLRRTSDRSLPAVYQHQPAKFTTEQATGLGIRDVIGEFSTGGFAADSGVNIRTIAAEVDGALIKPGETFSLNTHTGPRGTGQGYVEAGIIDKGRPGRAVGGGCSQFATTLYNASYFAGMADVAHKEHSYYISRYPEAREATVFEGQIDLSFRNDAPTGALIQTIWTPTSITVKIWGTKNYEVESLTGARSTFTEPGVLTIPFGEKCSPGNGAQGFTVSNTRVVRDARTHAELRRNTRTVIYNPIPKIICETQPPPPPPG